jgi:hypothetical protein
MKLVHPFAYDISSTKSRAAFRKDASSFRRTSNKGFRMFILLIPSCFLGMLIRWYHGSSFSEPFTSAGFKARGSITAGGSLLNSEPVKGDCCGRYRVSLHSPCEIDTDRQMGTVSECRSRPMCAPATTFIIAHLRFQFDLGRRRRPSSRTRAVKISSARPRGRLPRFPAIAEQPPKKPLSDRVPPSGEELSREGPGQREGEGVAPSASHERPRRQSRHLPKRMASVAKVLDDDAFVLAPSSSSVIGWLSGKR